MHHVEPTERQGHFRIVDWLHSRNRKADYQACAEQNTGTRWASAARTIAKPSTTSIIDPDEKKIS
jgi:hypothetical protein